MQKAKASRQMFRGHALSSQSRGVCRPGAAFISPVAWKHSWPPAPLSDFLKKVEESSPKALGPKERVLLPLHLHPMAQAHPSPPSVQSASLWVTLLAAQKRPPAQGQASPSPDPQRLLPSPDLAGEDVPDRPCGRSTLHSTALRALPSSSTPSS